MKQATKSAITTVIVFAIGTAVGYYYMPAKTIEVEKVVTKDQVKTITVEREITKKDGTVVKEKKDIKDVKKETDTKKSTIVEKNNYQWSVSAMVGKDTNWETTMGAAVQKRIVGPFSGGVYLIPSGTNMQGGFIFTYEF